MKKQALKYSVFHVEGGLGKNVAATAVAKTIKDNFPERQLIIVASYPEVFLNLDFVDRVFRIGITPYFYSDYIDGKDTLIFKHEPYFTQSHIQKNTNLIESWCKLYQLEYSGQKPILNIPSRIKDLTKNQYGNNVPTMIIHSNGGVFQGQKYPYAWTRDMPKKLVELIVQTFSHKYRILQICRDQQNVVNGVQAILQPMSNLELFSLLYLSERRLLIDSSLQHAAAALDLPSTVLWIGTSPKIFGYDLHTNIIANEPKIKPKLVDSYLFDYSFEGRIHEYPYMEDEPVFNIEEVIESLR
jgi:hypothetical protein